MERLGVERDDIFTLIIIVNRMYSRHSRLNQLPVITDPCVSVSLSLLLVDTSISSRSVHLFIVLLPLDTTRWTSTGSRGKRVTTNPCLLFPPARTSFLSPGNYSSPFGKRTVIVGTRDVIVGRSSPSLSYTRSSPSHTVGVAGGRTVGESGFFQVLHRRPLVSLYF